MIIGLHGLGRSGKDTVGDYLVKYHGFIKRSFADPLYDEVASAFDVSVEFLKDHHTKTVPCKSMSIYRCKDIDFIVRMVNLLGGEEAAFYDRTSREILQWWANDYQRIGDPKRYTRMLKEKIEHLRVSHHIVVPDLRHDIEAAMLLSYGARFWHITREGTINTGHSSDAPLYDTFTMTPLGNDGSIENLQQKVNLLMGKSTL